MVPNGPDNLARMPRADGFAVPPPTRRAVSLPACLFLVFLVAACADSAPELGQAACLMRVGEHCIMLAEFNRAFEIAKTAYPHGTFADAASSREVRLRFLNQFTERALILARAGELGISVSDEEAAKAIDAIRGDYPDDRFEAVFLECAVPYPLWENEIRQRLIMEKVVAMEVTAKVTLTPAEIKAYCREHLRPARPPEATAATGSGDESAPPEPGARPEDPQADEERIVRYLRKMKAEKAYAEWMDTLEQNYPVEIKWDLLEKDMGASQSAVFQGSPPRSPSETGG